jgi:regulatory LuxR family protein
MLLLVQGASTKSISQILGLSPRTVDVHASSIIRKLGARNRIHAAALAVHAGIVTPHLDALPRRSPPPFSMVASTAVQATTTIGEAGERTRSS